MRGVFIFYSARPFACQMFTRPSAGQRVTFPALSICCHLDSSLGVREEIACASAPPRDIIAQAQMLIRVLEFHYHRDLHIPGSVGRAGISNRAVDYATVDGARRAVNSLADLKAPPLPPARTEFAERRRGDIEESNLDRSKGPS